MPLPQLTTLSTLLNQTLDIIDISTWTGDPQNGSFIAGQLRLLADTIDEARQTLKGGEDIVGGKWWEEIYSEDVSYHLLTLLLLWGLPFNFNVPNLVAYIHSLNTNKARHSPPLTPQPSQPTSPSLTPRSSYTSELSSTTTKTTPPSPAFPSANASV